MHMVGIRGGKRADWVLLCREKLMLQAVKSSFSTADSVNVGELRVANFSTFER